MKVEPKYKKLRERFNSKYSGLVKRAAEYGVNIIDKEELWQNVKNQYDNGFKCAYCGEQMLDSDPNPPHYKSYSLEHIVSLHKGGTNDISNITFVCTRCNICKGTMYEETYRSILHAIDKTYDIQTKESILNEWFDAAKNTKVEREKNLFTNDGYIAFQFETDGVDGEVTKFVLAEVNKFLKIESKIVREYSNEFTFEDDIDYIIYDRIKNYDKFITFAKSWQLKHFTINDIVIDKNSVFDVKTAYNKKYKANYKWSEIAEREGISNLEKVEQIVQIFKKVNNNYFLYNKTKLPKTYRTKQFKNKIEVNI